MNDAELILGAVVTCSDGECGVLQRFEIDPATHAVTHLVVEPHDRPSGGRLVPVELVDATTAQEIRLRCTVVQFDALDPAGITEVRGELGVDVESQAASVDPSDHQMTYVLLDEGHLWGDKEVAIPVGAVTMVVDDGIYLRLTKKEVGELPPVDLAHSE